VGGLVGLRDGVDSCKDKATDCQVHCRKVRVAGDTRTWMRHSDIVV